MPNSDPIVAYADFPQPAFVCSHANVGLDAAWVHVAGELDIATAPQLAQTLRDAEPHARLIALDLRDQHEVRPELGQRLYSVGCKGLVRC